MERLAKKIRKAFAEKFGSEPLMIASPGRINLIGEHIDYSDGFVFPAAIDKYVVAGIQKSKTSAYNAFALDLNEAFTFNRNSLEPIKNGNWRNFVVGIVAQLIQMGLTIGPFDLVFGGNIPSGAGLSSSAGLENSIVFGLNELFALGLSKKEMALVSQRAEHEHVGVKCGIMDQYASMFGKKGHFLLLDCRTVESEPYGADFKDHALVLINSNVKHELSDSAYNDRRSVVEDVSRRLGIKALRDASFEMLDGIRNELSSEDFQKTLFVLEEIQRTQKAAIALRTHAIEELGGLLYASHSGLSAQYKVSCPELDFLVEVAKEHHVTGARMMGGGFGGCTINLVKRALLNDFVADASKRYLDRYGNECTVINIELSDGTHRIL